MTVVIAGGSNSLIKEGWTAHFSKDSVSDVRNLSVGASTTLSAIFRILQADGPSPGDTVVWEYALNEINHITNKGYDVYNILKNLEHFIILCRDKGCRIAPVLFTPRSQEKAKERHQYYAKIKSIFAAYGIEVFDVSQEYRKHYGLGRIPANLFSDRAHYATDPAFMDFISKGCFRLVDSSTRPRHIPPIYTGNKTVKLVDGFCDTNFSNSIMSIPAACPPIEYVMEAGGDLIAVYAVFYSGEESGIWVQASSEERKRPWLSFPWARSANHRRRMWRFRFSATRKRDIMRPILKAVCTENIAGGRWTIHPGMVISIGVATGAGRYHAEHGMVGNLKTLTSSPQTRISGILLEAST